MENTIRVLKIEPGKAPYVKEIVDDYKVSQSEVGGDIDCFDTEDGCVVVHNAEGKNKKLEPNRRYGDDIIWVLSLSVQKGKRENLYPLRMSR